MNPNQIRPRAQALTASAVVNVQRAAPQRLYVVTYRLPSISSAGQMMTLAMFYQYDHDYILYIFTSRVTRELRIMIWR